MEESIMQELWKVKKELDLLKGSIAALEAVYGKSERIPHKAMEIAFGWEPIRGES